MAKSPSAPSIYDTMGSMAASAPPPGATPPPPGQSTAPGAEGGDELQIVTTLMRVLEKWRTTAKDKKAADPYIQRLMDTLNEYMTNVLKQPAAAANKAETPAPTSPGPSPMAASPAETSPVPA